MESKGEKWRESFIEILSEKPFVPGRIQVREFGTMFDGKFDANTRYSCTACGSFKWNSAYARKPSAFGFLK